MAKTSTEITSRDQAKDVQRKLEICSITMEVIRSIGESSIGDDEMYQKISKLIGDKKAIQYMKWIGVDYTPPIIPIMTAEEAVEQWRSKAIEAIRSGVEIEGDSLEEVLIKFAKSHVAQQAKVISELEETNGTEGYKVYPEAILNAYPLDNIK